MYLGIQGRQFEEKGNDILQVSQGDKFFENS